MTVKPMFVDMYLIDFIGTIHIMRGRYGPDIAVQSIDTGATNRISYLDLAPFMLQTGDIVAVADYAVSVYKILEISFKLDQNGWGDYCVMVECKNNHTREVRMLGLNYFIDNELFFIDEG